MGPPEPESAIEAHLARIEAQKRDDARGLHPVWKYGPAATSLLDSWTTQRGLDGGGAHETNPLMAPFVGNDVTLYAVPAALGLATGYLADKLAKRGHRNVAKAFSGLTMGVHLGASANNIAVAARERRERGE